RPCPRTCPGTASRRAARNGRYAWVTTSISGPIGTPRCRLRHGVCMPTWRGCSPGLLRCETQHQPDKAPSMKSRAHVFQTVRTALVDLFELDAPNVVPEARFDDDLEIDSIDAVDLIDHLSRIFERRVSPRDFRAVRTVQDLIDTIDRLQTQ